MSVFGLRLTNKKLGSKKENPFKISSKKSTTLLDNGPKIMLINTS